MIVSSVLSGLIVVIKECEDGKEGFVEVGLYSFVTVEGKDVVSSTVVGKIEVGENSFIEEVILAEDLKVEAVEIGFDMSEVEWTCDVPKVVM